MVERMLLMRMERWKRERERGVAEKEIVTRRCNASVRAETTNIGTSVSKLMIRLL